MGEPRETNGLKLFIPKYLVAKSGSAQGHDPTSPARSPSTWNGSKSGQQNVYSVNGQLKRFFNFNPVIMANTATENEADSGSSIVTVARVVEKQEDDQPEEAVTGSNSNYDSSEGGYKCTVCDFEAVTPSALTNHITISHTASSEAEMEAADASTSPPERAQRKAFDCDICKMKFSNGANMRRHKMRHTGVKPYECKVCQKRFFRKDHLAEHFTTHTKALPYHCPICNRGFQRQIAMRAHFQNEHVGQHDLVKS
ncbi:hypothetical protein HUJ05_000646 [Dendroctonus ponderosae]|nr:hypothetical protein HUJ05_000646 [Dendroctonus ponderosae]